jgi:TonB family protein
VRGSARPHRTRRDTSRSGHPSAPASRASTVRRPAGRIAAGVLAGQVLSKVAPVYPAKAKTARIAGAVILQAIISKTGDIQSLRVLSGPDELRISALDAVRQWKYKPYLLDGEPTEVDTTITVTYSLGDAVPPPATGPAAELAIRQIGGYVSAPALLSSAEANYSEEARAQKISGTVVVHLLVDTQGNATQVRVLRGLGHGLDEKAVQAVSTYKFRPALDHGQPVPVALNVEVNFRSF